VPPDGDVFPGTKANGRIVLTFPGLGEAAEPGVGVFTVPGTGGRLMAQVPAAVIGLPQSA
jgi:hypothetical protein